MSLEVDVEHRLGTVTLQAQFTAAGRLTALFGRSGAGKTSLVNIIAGLTRPDRARIVVDGVVLADTGRGIDLPPHRRRVGYVFQEGRLFPHLTVRQNLTYGRWFTPASARWGSFDGVVAMLGIGPLLDRRPALLSGGEKQRVAIGRALLSSPRVLLMDEPLAALDEARKAEILPYVERLRDEGQVPIVYVSHAVSEVARLASTVVLLAAGRVVATGDAVDVLGRLDLMTATGGREGGAILDTRIERHDARYDLTVLSCAAGEIVVPRLDRPAGAITRIRIQARDVMIATVEPSGISAQNILQGTIAEIGQPTGGSVDIRLDCRGQALLASLTRRAVDQLGLRTGLAVFAVVKTVALADG